MMYLFELWHWCNMVAKNFHQALGLVFWKLTMIFSGKCIIFVGVFLVFFHDISQYQYKKICLSKSIILDICKYFVWKNFCKPLEGKTCGRGCLERTVNSLGYTECCSQGTHRVLQPHFWNTYTQPASNISPSKITFHLGIIRKNKTWCITFLIFS